MQSTKKKKGAKARFNIIDLLIIVLVIACAVGVYIKHISSENIDTDQSFEEAQLSFLVQDIRYTSAEFFENGEREVYLADDGTKLGEFMKGFTITPAEKYLTDSMGKPVKVVYPENTRIDVRGKILSEGMWTDEGFMVGGNLYVAAGKQMEIATSDIVVTLVVTDVTKN